MTSDQLISIFYIEDNEVSRLTLKNELRGVTDFRIVGEATSGESALTQLSDTNIIADVVLADIGLPDIDGIEVIKQIKATRPHARVLMLTASDDANDIFDALDAGADGYMLKAMAARQKEHARNLEMAIRSVTVGAVWLDPMIAQLVLKTSDRPVSPRKSKVEPIALSHEEKTLLGQVAESNCEDGVCLVQPDFLNKLRRFRDDHQEPPVSAAASTAPVVDSAVGHCDRK